MNGLLDLSAEREDRGCARGSAAPKQLTEQLFSIAELPREGRLGREVFGLGHAYECELVSLGRRALNADATMLDVGGVVVEVPRAEFDVVRACDVVVDNRRRHHER